MKVNVIIAEYNPFHNGHKYHLANATRKTGADYTIVIMSGNFVQRGAPALLDKFERAHMALLNGADLCLELPTCYAVCSAEYFANGAVALADKLGVVTHLCFGSECGNIEVLERIARILLEEPEVFSKSLKTQLKLGISYPIARTNALLQYDASLSNSRDVLSSPNNILGIEYIKALLRRGSAITPMTTIRVGADYHDKRLGEHQCSARAIRHALIAGQHLTQLKTQLPAEVYDIMEKACGNRNFMYSNTLSMALHYKLIQEKAHGYADYMDISPELSDRIVNHLYEFQSYDAFCDLLKTKDMTYTRISRCLLHILLDLKKEQMENYKQTDYVPYARILGFRKDSTPLLSAIKENASIPLISKLADADKLLNASAYAMLQNEVRMNDIYQSTLAQLTARPMENEYSTPIVIV